MSTNSGGSGHGHSYWKAWIECPRKAYLNETLGVSMDATDVMDIGSGVHELCHRAELGDSDLPVEYTQDPAKPMMEAARIYKQYRALCPPGYWGKPVCMEEVLTLPADSDLFKYFKHEVTIKPDAVREVDQATAERIAKEFKLVLRPGLYLQDYKTVAGIPSDTSGYYHSIQFKLYSLIWNHLRPEQKLSGTIVTFISRAKTVRVVPIVIPQVREIDRHIVTAFLWEASQRKDHAFEDADNGFPTSLNNTYCHTCHHFKSGACERY